MTKHWKLLLVRLQHSHTEFIRKKKEKESILGSHINDYDRKKKNGKIEKWTNHFFPQYRLT